MLEEFGVSTGVVFQFIDTILLGVWTSHNKEPGTSERVVEVATFHTFCKALALTLALGTGHPEPFVAVVVEPFVW